MTMIIDQPTPSGVPAPTSARVDRRRPEQQTRTPIRYTAKLARRELRRRPWRGILVILLVAVPTWIMLNALAYARTGQVVDGAPPPDFSSDLVASFTEPTDGQTPIVDNADGTMQYELYPRSDLSAADVEAALPAGSTVQRVIGGKTSIMTEDGKIEGAEFIKTDLASAAAATWAPLVEGRAPEFGEVVLGRYLADRLGLTVGDTLKLQQPAGQWRVVGIAASGSDELMLVRDFDESQLATVDGRLLIDLPADVDTSEVQRLENEIGAWTPNESRFAVSMPVYDSGDNPIALTWLASVMLFLMFGVIIVAAFATIARGQLVTVGQLAANGADRRVTRRVLALQGFWAGTVGVTVGGIAMLATLPLLRPLMLASFYWPAERLEWNPIDVVVIAVVGIGVATAAAALPSFALVKVSVLDALAGRRPEHPVPKWMVPVGVASFGLGLLLLVTSSSSVTSAGPAGAMLGVLAMVIGVCLIGPLVIQLASRTAGVMPLSIRVSLRGLGRARLRSAAVVSSIAVTAGVMAAIVAGFQTSAGGPVAGQAADDVAVVVGFPSLALRSPNGTNLFDAQGKPIPDRVVGLDSVVLSWVAADVSAEADRVRGVLPDATVQPVRVAVRPDGEYDNTDGQLVAPGGSGDEAPSPDSEVAPPPPSGEELPGGRLGMELEMVPLIADDATLAALSLPDSFRQDLAIAGHGVAVSEGYGAGCPADFSEEPRWDGSPVEAPSDDGSNIDKVPGAMIPTTGIHCGMYIGSFMTEQFATDHGYQIEAAGTVFTSSDPLTDSERSALDSRPSYPSRFNGWAFPGTGAFSQNPAVSSALVAHSYSAVQPGISIYWPSINSDDFALVQLTLLGISVVFVTLIAGIGLGLAAADSRRDRAVLSVVGAKPSTQRRIAATDALVLVVIGTTLGVPAALFAARVVTTANYQSTPTGIPWPFVLAEFVVVPLVVAGFAFLAGWLRRPASPMQVLQVD